MNDNEISALFKLLADPDQFISVSAKNKIIDEFENLEEKIFDALIKSEDFDFTNKAKELVHEVNFNKAITYFKTWQDVEQINLIKGLFYISKLFHFDADYLKIKMFFDDLVINITTNTENLSPIEQIRFLNFILFKTNNFKIDQNISSTNAFMLDTAIQKRQTSVFLMNVIYFNLARMLNIPLYFVFNNRLFLLGYYEVKNIKTTSEFIKCDFFVNTSNKGFVHTYEDIRAIKDKINENFIILTPIQIIKQLIKILTANIKKPQYIINNLIQIYNILEQPL